MLMLVNTSISENAVIYVCQSNYMKDLTNLISESMKTNTGKR